MNRRWLKFQKGFLRTVLPMLRLLPPRRAAQVLAGFGRAEYLLRPDLRRIHASAAARGARHFGRDDWDLPALGRDLAGNHSRWLTRDMILDGLPDSAVEPLFHVRGREHLDAAYGAGRGVILLFSHYGANIMPAHWLTRQGLPIRWFTERPRLLSKYLSRQFESEGPLGQRKLFISRKTDPTEAAGSILRASRMLKAGLIVKIAGDVRWTGPHTIPARFLGRSYRFTTTWVALAALTGAPVLPVFCRMTSDGAYDLEFLPSFHVPKDAKDLGKTPLLVQSYLHEIEARVERDPANSGDYFYWTDALQPPAEAA